MAYNLEKFKKGLDDLQIHLDEKQMGQFLTYYELLVETNKVMNLTAITEFDEVIEKHFLDSLVVSCEGFKKSRKSAGGISDSGSWDGSRISGNSFKDCFSETSDCAGGFTE